MTDQKDGLPTERDEWPWNLNGPCTVTFEDDAAPKSGRCELVRMHGGTFPIYSGTLTLAEWEGGRSRLGVLRHDHMEMDISVLLGEVRDDGSEHVWLAATSHGAPRRFSELR